MAAAKFVVDEEVKWKAFLQYNRTTLVTELDFESLSSEAMKRGIITEEEIQRIQFNSSANHRRVGAFLDGLIKKTTIEYHHFRECLKCMNKAARKVDSMLEKTFPEYEKSLEVQLQKMKPKRQQREKGEALSHFPVGHQASEMEIEEMKTKIASVQVPDNFRVSSLEFYLNHKEESYDIGRGVRGRVLIVTMTTDQGGWKRDVEALATLFKALSFEMVACFDPTASNLRKELQRFAKDEANRNADCVFVVFMGHGDKTAKSKQYFITADGHPFEVEVEIQEIFNNMEAPYLRDKPKMFIFQLFRGQGCLDPSVNITDSTHRVLPRWTDFVLAYAFTDSRGNAYRKSRNGSLYIQAVSEVFLNDAHNQSILDMLCRVDRVINEKNEADNEYVGTVVTASLNQKLFLFPGIMPKSM